MSDAASRLGTAEVQTESGRVRGRWEQELAVFRGIPFAQAPVGALRFAAPHPPAPWDDVRDAFDFGPPAPQETSFSGRSGTLAGTRGDDWLTVNVWTPCLDPGIRRPVLVWVYGGAYKLGFSGSPGYDMRHVASAGNLVVVTFNYRVGIEGFAHIDGAPANRGLLDQVAALEWVRENIAGFGGDPGQVTVCGESAGAGSIAALLAMPSARGLFGRAIVQSMPGTFFSAELAADIAAELASAAGSRPTVADLSDIEPWTLPDAAGKVAPNALQYADRWGTLAHTISVFAPVIDGDVLPVTPWQALAAGQAREVDLIVGHNRDECRLFLALGGMLDEAGDERADTALRVFGPGDDSETAYRTAYPDASAVELLELVQSDWLFRMPALHLAQAHYHGGGRTYMYELTWPAPGAGGDLGACHGLDGPLLTGNFGAQLGPMLLGDTPPPEAYTLSRYIQRRWVEFAATGNPGWPAYDPDQRLVQVLDASPSITRYPEERSRRLWQNHAFVALPLLRADIES